MWLVENFPSDVLLPICFACNPFFADDSNKVVWKKHTVSLDTKFYTVLRNIAPYYKLPQGKTPYYKVPCDTFSVLQMTKDCKVLQSPTSTRYYKILHSTTKYYTILESTTRYYAILQTCTECYSELHGTYKINTQCYEVHPVLHCTTGTTFRTKQ